MVSEHCTRLRMPAQAEHLQALRAQVRTSALRQGFAVAAVEDLVLAVNEACMNVIQHGYRGAAGEIELTIVALDDGIEFRVRDDAPRIGLDDWRPRPLDDIRPGGLGVHFIRATMDHVDYDISQPEGTVLTLVKQLPQGGE